MSDFQDKVIEELIRTKVPVPPIKLAYIAERDGLVFLCDKEGKELGQVVPKEPNIAMIDAVFPLRQTGKYQAMISAAKVDVSAALVKVPERRGAVDGDHDFDECKGWDACLDELEGK